LRRFKGIATAYLTHYLTHYLGWFRALDRNTQTGAHSAQWLTLAVRA